MNILNFIFFLNIFLVSMSGMAQNTTLTCSKKGTTILYANGVNVSDDDARNALKRIGKLVPKNQLDEKSNVSFDLTYNYSLGLNLDILEVITQKLPKAFLQSNNYIDKYDAFYKFKNGLSKVALEYLDISVMEEIINDTNQVMLNHILDVRDQTVNEYATIYSDILNEGKKILTVSHSQGGLFVNDAFNALTFSDKNKFFQSIQIATPANSIVNGGGYNTYYGDEVINNLRSALGALPGNTSSTLLPWPLSLLDRPEHEYLTEEDKIDKYLNHGILSTYLADSNLRGAIVNKIKKVALNLKSNCDEIAYGCFKDGLIQEGKLHKNPDGSTGGFVSNTASVGSLLSGGIGFPPPLPENIYLGADVQICDQSHINGNVTILGEAKILGNTTISAMPANIIIKDKVQITDAMIGAQWADVEISDEVQILGGRIGINGGIFSNKVSIGGKVSITDTLNFAGNTFSGNAKIFGTDNGLYIESSTVSDNATIYGEGIINISTIKDNALVYGNISLENVEISGSAKFCNGYLENFVLSGNMEMCAPPYPPILLP